MVTLAIISRTLSDIENKNETMVNQIRDFMTVSGFGSGYLRHRGCLTTMMPNTSFQRAKTARLFGPLNSDR